MCGRVALVGLTRQPLTSGIYLRKHVGLERLVFLCHPPRLLRPVMFSGGVTGNHCNWLCGQWDRTRLVRRDNGQDPLLKTSRPRTRCGPFKLYPFKPPGQGPPSKAFAWLLACTRVHKGPQRGINVSIHSGTEFRVRCRSAGR